MVCDPRARWMLPYLSCTCSRRCWWGYQRIRGCWPVSSSSTQIVWEEQYVTSIRQTLTVCVLIAGSGSRRRGFSTELNRLLPSCRLHSNEFDILTSSWNRSPGTTIIRESGLRFLERSQDGGREVECFLCYPSSIPPASVYWVLVIKEAWVRVWGIWWSARQLKSLPLVHLQYSCNIYLKLDTVRFPSTGAGD